MEARCRRREEEERVSEEEERKWKNWGGRKFFFSLSVDSISICIICVCVRVYLHARVCARVLWVASGRVANPGIGLKVASL